jgi:hypothetical protein
MLHMKLWSTGIKYGALAIGLAMAILLIMDFNGRMAELNRLKGQRDQVAAQATSLAQTQVGFKTQIAYATSEAGVLEWAYQDGHWVREGDYLVVPVPKGDATIPTPTPVPQPTPEPVSNVQLWMTLFFDQR